MDNLRVGDKVLCTKGCTCGCGLIEGKIYTIEFLFKKEPFKNNDPFYLKEIKEEKTGRRFYDMVNENYSLKKVKSRELQLELF